MLICVGIPVIDGKPYAQTVDSLLAEQVRAMGQGVHILVLWQIGVASPNIARNKLVSQFLSIPNADRLVFVDADISWKTGDLLNIALSDKPVIGATYRAKSEKTSFHIDGKPEKDGHLYRVDGLPGGFIAVSRSVFEEMPRRPYKDSAGAEWNDWFMVGFHNGRLYGEDYGFCRLWRDMGGEIWLDPSIKLRHHDGLRAFTGDPEEWLNGDH